MASTITMFRNNTRLYDTTVSHTLLGSSGLTGFTCTFTAKRDPSDTTAQAVLRKTGAGQCAVTTVGSTTVDGVITTTILPADTATLPGQYPTYLYFDVKAVDGSGVQTTADSGTLLVNADISQ